MGGEPSTRLPEELSGRISGYVFSRHPYHESQAEIHVLTHQVEPTLYLKIRRDHSKRLLREYDMLKWINQRVPTPEPLYYGEEDSTEYLLTSEVAGTPVYQVAKDERETAIIILAETLKSIHSLDTSGCPVDTSIDNWLLRLGAEGVDISSLEACRPQESHVFTHGDYCLPNIIIRDGRLSGVIDWDYAGLADPYIDFASCLWSIRYNFGEIESDESLIPLFLETYGVEINPEKYEFYQRLRDLTP